MGAAIQANVQATLTSIYEEVMWLAKRPKITASAARAWYTHVVHSSVTRQIRRFTGKVSRSAIDNEEGDLRLEHFKRIQTTLTQLVARHIKSGSLNPQEFIETVLDCEQVHIVTKTENYAAMRAKGDYSLAGIELVSWDKIPVKRRHVLWKKMLRGKVANAAEFKTNEG